MNINVDFRNFVNAGHSVFLKKRYNTNKITTKNLFENCRFTIENAMIFTCAQI